MKVLHNIRVIIMLALLGSLAITNLNAQRIVLTSDQQLIDLQDPDKEIDMSMNMFNQRHSSLRQFCEGAQSHGSHTLSLAFDEFYSRFRNTGNTERKLTPDSDEFIKYIANISKFAENYGLGLHLSVLSPLEIGKAYTKSENESGHWLQYAVDMCDSATGKFSTMQWEVKAFSNNKGKIRPKRENVRVFAFNEADQPFMPETSQERIFKHYRAVNPNDMVEITSGIQIENWESTFGSKSGEYESQRIRIYSEDNEQIKGFNRVLIVLKYATPEMDYFSPRALPYLKELVAKYHNAGVNLVSFYSDEMHIQRGTSYMNNRNNGQFNQRYMTDNMAREYASRYGAEFADIDKYMLYFVYGPAIYGNDQRSARTNIQYVMGESPEEMQKTVQFRDRYFRMLNDEVVELFIEAKKAAENIYGYELPTRAHATWMESPTFDTWDVGLVRNSRMYNYDYSPAFVASNTVHQAAAACYDYFKWGEYLSPMGTDQTEVGMGDRNYYAAALASSFAMVNKSRISGNGGWGMPPEVRQRWDVIYSAFGSSGRFFRDKIAVTGNVHRDVNVLMLYPMSVVASEERFGNWMTQYGYANYLTSNKLLEEAEVLEDGTVAVCDHHFNTLVALFEPFPEPQLLDIMEEAAMKGGKVIWSGPPPILNSLGEPCLERWSEIFGVAHQPAEFQGKIAAGKKVTFLNDFNEIEDQTILTDFLVDQIYPVTATENSVAVAKVGNDVVGTVRSLGKGLACFLGFRPRDDQSCSLGYEQRTWFEILDELGAYPSTGKFSGFNDNTEHISRTTDYLCTRFPNGTTVIAHHYRTHAEDWPGGYARVKNNDEQYLVENPMPEQSLDLDKFKVNDHEISFKGDELVAFQMENNKLKVFEGSDCREITIDDKSYQFADENLKHVAWSPVEESQNGEGQAFHKIWLEGSGKVTIPVNTAPKNFKMYAKHPIADGNEIPFKYKKGEIMLTLDNSNTGRWLYLVGE